jgi:hypothetical protein
MSGEEVYLVFPQLRKAFFREMENIFKNPVHYRNRLAEFVSVMVGVSLLFRHAPALLI